MSIPVLAADRTHETSPAAAPTRKPRRRGLPGALRWISPVALVLLWQLTSSTGLLPADKMAPPSQVIAAGIDLATSGQLGDAFVVSLQRVLAGVAIGAVIALVLGIAAGLSRWGALLIDPPVQMLRTLPFLGLIPLFIIWFGIGEEPKIALVALGFAFPFYLNVYAGIRDTDPLLLEAASVLGFTRWERLLHVVIPAALPQALVGLRQGLGVAWLSLIVGEQINADAGLGYLINNARDFLRTDQVVVGLVVYAALGLATDALVRALERRALRWRNGR